MWSLVRPRLTPSPVRCREFDPGWHGLCQAHSADHSSPFPCLLRAVPDSERSRAMCTPSRQPSVTAPRPAECHTVGGPQAPGNTLTKAFRKALAILLETSRRELIHSS